MKTMSAKSFVVTFLLLTTLICICECVYVYSSFWAPLFNPKILNYHVDSDFKPIAGQNARNAYEKSFGYRGEKLIDDLGTGKPPSNPLNNKLYGDVKFYYTNNADGRGQ